MAGYHIFVSQPERFGQQMAAAFVCGQCACLRLPGEEGILGGVGVGDVCYLIVGQEICVCHTGLRGYYYAVRSL